MHFALFDILSDDHTRSMPALFPDIVKKTTNFFDNLTTVSESIINYLSDDKTENAKVNKTKFEISGISWNRLDHHLGAHICSFLSPQELSAFGAVSQFTREVFRYMAHDGSQYWSNAMKIRFAPLSMQGSGQGIVKYLNLHLKNCQSQEQHFKSAEHCYSAFYQYCTRKQGTGIIGLVCDIGWFDDEIIAKVISRKRYMAMLTVLTEHERDVYMFKKAITDDGRGPRSFLPVSSAPTLNTIDIDLERVKANSIIYPGFIGFAVNMVRLRPEHEYLRYTVFWGLFRDLMIFKTLDSASEYSRFLTVDELEKFWVVTLDRYSDEELNNTYPCMSATTPRDLTEMYRRSPWEVQASLRQKVSNAQLSYEIARYSY